MRKIVYLVRYGKRCDVYPDAREAIKRRDFLRTSSVPTAYVDSRALTKAEMDSLLGRDMLEAEWNKYQDSYT